jgi:hypothetical protein
LFPDLAVEMLEVGESTGALPAMLGSVAEFYEEDVQTALSAAMALIEPLILIVMAVFVGGILISLYMPIFTLGAITFAVETGPAPVFANPDGRLGLKGVGLGWKGWLSKARLPLRRKAHPRCGGFSPRGRRRAVNWNGNGG